MGAYTFGYINNIMNADANSIDATSAGSKKEQETGPKTEKENESNKEKECASKKEKTLKSDTSRQRQRGLANFYFYPLVAHVLHLSCTILPLVVANLHTQTVSWYSSYVMEGLVYLSLPITHVCYLHWGIIFDRVRNESTIKDKPSEVLPERLRIKNPFRILLISFVLGQIPLLAIPHMMGECPKPVPVSSPSIVVDTYTATVREGSGSSWEDWCAQNDYSGRAQNQAGNLYFSMSASHQNPNEYRFVEHWDSVESYKTWRAGDFLQSFYANEKTHNLLKDNSPSVPSYHTMDPASCTKSKTDERKCKGSVHLELGASCETVWTSLSDWSDCKWFPECSKVVVSEENQNLHTQTNADGSEIKKVWHEIDHNNYRLLYEITDAPLKDLIDFTGAVTLSERGEGCNVLYDFSASDSLDTADIYDYFYSVSVPELIKSFAK